MKANHYKQNGMEAIEVIRAFSFGNFHIGNALKYLLRCGRKIPEGMSEGDAMVSDLQKAADYIQMEISRLKLTQCKCHQVKMDEE